MNLKKLKVKKTIAFGVGMPRANNKSKKYLPSTAVILVLQLCLVGRLFC